MIGELSEEQFLTIIKILTTANENLKVILATYNKMAENTSAKMDRFTKEIDNYINYLNRNYKINKDAEEALARLKELNN